MKRTLVLAFSLVLALTVAAEAFGQGRQTGTIGGTAVDAQGLSLPGVTMTVSSPSLQGTRTAVTDINGNYSLPQLPPGAYSVVFTLSGFGDVEQAATVPLGGEVGVNAVMAPGGVTETVQVVGVVPAEIQTTETASNMVDDVVNVLPMGRTPFAIAAIQPGLNTNTPNSGQLAINGSFAYDNVYLVDGVDTNDNLYGTSNNLYVADAIEETQVLTSGISAEYGRFSGGVVNVITKSGGNTFSGSWRSNFDKPTWESLNPYEVENEVNREDILNRTHEATLGGPIVRDRLWFFYSFRRARTTDSDSFAQTGISFNETVNNDRNQAKLTATLAPGHTLSGQYMRNQTSQGRPTFGFSITPDTQIDRTLPNDLYVTTYRGSLTQNVFAEAQVSQKQFGFRGAGGTETAIGYSPFITLTQQLGHFNAPYFDATDPEDRNNLQVTGNVTWYRGTESLGSHSVKVGFESYRSTRTGGNSQSSTGYVFDADYMVDANGDPVLVNNRLIPVFSQFESLIENWIPSRGARINLNTSSFFINDNWALNEHLSFNLGVRGEFVSGEATPGDITTVDTQAIVPRLAASYDPLGDGRYSIQATYSHYAGKYSEAQFAENTNVGKPSLLYGYYVGPTHTCPGLPDATAADCPGLDPNNYVTFYGSFPTQNVFADDRLNSPITQEFTLSSGATLGDRGYVQATYVRRRAGSFVEDYLDLTTGSTTLMDDDGNEYGTFTNQVYANPGDLGDDADALQRNYDGLQFETRYSVFDDLLLNGSWTIQLTNEGNFDGEGVNTPATPSVYGDWPEVTPADRFHPWGRLDDFQGHRLRVWGIYTLGMGAFGDLDIGGFWRYDSAENYSLASSSFRVTDEQQAILDELGYVDGPTSRTLYYSEGRGSELYNGSGRFDLSLHYDVPVRGRFRPWVKIEWYNLTNNDKLLYYNTTIRHDASGPTGALGIPTTYTQGPRFGEATSAGHYRAARSFLISAGC